ncbi:hypothetical protein DLAC_07547 [Tieghemostelium lacteum]|uniref:Rhodanese domain-containing protein n=1 Tax=Tieghemostelium lacteum TaxID=361077 RepID=A0A151ZCV4_TIELA|nr:hypothetical protein DLAC_07547 [Tieghemostelium lacteum]|eukprot:KYQ91759.1 hypothetical protein DLAC_07547 [Tieghemostelium lacteum]
MIKNLIKTSNITYQRFYSTFNFRENKTINKDTLKQLITENRGKSSKSFYLIDVRNPSEVQNSGLIESAINLPLGVIPAALELKPEDFEETFNFKKFNKNDNIVFYCQKGIRSDQASTYARQQGYENSVSYPGSKDEWDSK